MLTSMAQLVENLLEVDAADVVGNFHLVAAFEFAYNLAKLDEPVDRDEWHMTPQTVSAYYNPTMNEIVFPAAILQPPFFDADIDPAYNYGAIGAVIGHEIGHGFDDQGSRYDGDGTLRDWWTSEDLERFGAKVKALIDQYDQFSPRGLEGSQTVNGGLTGDQRFFVGWALAWPFVARPSEAIRRLTIDPHSPAEFRTNVVRNIDAFHEAFATEPGDGLWLEPDERIAIW